MKIAFTFVLFVSIFLLESCDSCKWLDCATDTYFARIRLVSSLNSDDLIFGPAKKYDKNQIVFYSVKGTDTSFFSSEAVAQFGTDSVLVVTFFPKADIAFMKLSDGDIDTLNITYDNRESKCCGTLTEIVQLRYNNKLTVPIASDPAILAK